MSDPLRPEGPAPSARFGDRAAAERAARRLAAAGIPEGAVRLSEEPGDGGVVLAASGLSPEQEARVRRLLAEDGAGDAADDPAHAPREVQPGFADVRPGYVPEPTYSTAVDSSQHPEGVPEPRGRFEDQLDKLPEGGAPRDAGAGRARVTIISPKEA